MADKDWTLKGFPLAMTIAGFTSWLVAAGIGTDIKHDRIKKEQENRAKTALIQSAPRADKSEGTLVSVVTGKPVENSKSRVNISRVNIIPFSYNITYARLTGEPSATGTIEISANSDINKKNTVIINESGLAE